MTKLFCGIRFLVVLVFTLLICIGAQAQFTAGGLPYEYYGVGSPVGRLSARPATIYMDTATGNLWAKQTGTSTSGWVLVGGAAAVTGVTNNQFLVGIPTGFGQGFTNTETKIDITAPPYNAVAGQDASVAINAALRYAAFTNGAFSRTVTWPENFRGKLTNKIVLPITTLYTDGNNQGYSYRLLGPSEFNTGFDCSSITNGHVIEFEASDGLTGRLNGVEIGGFYLYGPGVTNANYVGALPDVIWETTNYTSDGIFLGFTNNYVGDTAGYKTWIHNLNIRGFRRGLIVTNMVNSLFTTILSQNNWSSDILGSHLDQCAFIGLNLGAVLNLAGTTNFMDANLVMVDGGTGFSVDGVQCHSFMTFLRRASPGTVANVNLEAFLGQHITLNTIATEASYSRFNINLVMPVNSVVHKGTGNGLAKVMFEGSALSTAQRANGNFLFAVDGTADFGFPTWISQSGSGLQNLRYNTNVAFYTVSPIGSRPMMSERVILGGNLTNGTAMLNNIITDSPVMFGEGIGATKNSWMAARPTFAGHMAQHSTGGFGWQFLDSSANRTNAVFDALDIQFGGPIFSTPLTVFGALTGGTTVTATNGFITTTNYIASNFAPVDGMVKLVSSNNWMFAVTAVSTNPAFQTQP